MIHRGPSPFTHRVFVSKAGGHSRCHARLEFLGSYFCVDQGRTVGVYLCCACDEVIEAARRVSAFPYSTSIRPER